MLCRDEAGRSGDKPLFYQKATKRIASLHPTSLNQLSEFDPHHLPRDTVLQSALHETLAFHRDSSESGCGCVHDCVSGQTFIFGG